MYGKPQPGVPHREPTVSQAIQALNDFIDRQPIISTHEHHQAFPPGEPCTLEYLFQHSYVGWSGAQLASPEDRPRFLDLVSGSSYFIWHERAICDLFGMGKRVTPETWEAISSRCAAGLKDESFHRFILRDRMKCSAAILDAYWDPGGDNGRPDLYRPTLRINSFAYGRNLDMADHNGNNAQRLYGVQPDLSSYLAMASRVIGGAKARGCVALKSALAYDRHLLFTVRDRREVERSFGRAGLDPAADEAFGDFMFDSICDLAEEHDMPLQVHVGMARLAGSNPMNLAPMIERHPGTKFVLFHMGYPWIDEVCALSHNYANVYPDLCWMPQIGTTAACRALHALIETGKDSSRVCWGGDSWLVTESYGAALAMRWVLKKVLAERIEAGWLTPQRAAAWAEGILWQNASNLYGIPPPRMRV